MAHLHICTTKFCWASMAHSTACPDWVVKSKNTIGTCGSLAGQQNRLSRGSRTSETILLRKPAHSARDSQASALNALYLVDICKDEKDTTSNALVFSAQWTHEKVVERQDKCGPLRVQVGMLTSDS